MPRIPLPSFLLLLLASPFLTAPLLAQVGAGTLYQSLSPTQLPGVSAIGLRGNPSITTNEVVAFSANDAAGGARSLFNAQALGILLGDISGDGRPFDWPDIDALEVKPAPAGRNQPDIFDCRFSVSQSLVNTQGVTLATSGDVFRFTGVGTLAVVLTRSQLQAALGTSAPLDVDGYAELPDGSVIVSFRGTGSGNNIIHPTTGSTGGSVPWSGADVFIIRQPFGALPALFAYRQTELAVVVNFYYGNIPFTEVSGIDDQTLFPPGVNVPPLTNPNDPLGTYQNGRRPRLLWTIASDDNVFCWNNQLNPRTTQDNFYALIGNNSQSVAGYTTGLSVNRVFIDAISVTSTNLGSATRLTLDASSLTPNPGSNLTLTVRGAGPAGTVYQIAASGGVVGGQGVPFTQAGFTSVLLDLSDPILTWSLMPPVSTLFTTGPSDVNGTASTVPVFVLPALTGLPFTFQAFSIFSPFPISTPLTVVVN